MKTQLIHASFAVRLWYWIVFCIVCGFLLDKQTGAFVSSGPGRSGRMFRAPASWVTRFCARCIHLVSRRQHQATGETVRART